MVLRAELSFTAERSGPVLFQSFGPKPLLSQFLLDLTCSPNAKGLLAAATAIMDIVLEVLDTFLFDPIYATLLPANTPGSAPNATFSSMREVPTLPPTATTWQYKPASQYLSVEPGKYAYMSQWPRDDWRRQLFSLYLITWYALVASDSGYNRS